MSKYTDMYEKTMKMLAEKIQSDESFRESVREEYVLALTESARCCYAYVDDDDNEVHVAADFNIDYYRRHAFVILVAQYYTIIDDESYNLDVDSNKEDIKAAAEIAANEFIEEYMNM